MVVGNRGCWWASPSRVSSDRGVGGCKMNGVAKYVQPTRISSDGAVGGYQKDGGGGQKPFHLAFE
jgi:hypothetical protein